jgi:hypothetical protein
MLVSCKCLSDNDHPRSFSKLLLQSCYCSVILSTSSGILSTNCKALYSFCWIYRPNKAEMDPVWNRDKIDAQCHLGCLHLMGRSFKWLLRLTYCSLRYFMYEIWENETSCHSSRRTIKTIPFPEALSADLGPKICILSRKTVWTILERDPKQYILN